jgi:sulfate transport system substrate-binding protein
MVTHSAVVLVVRAGNPKKIKDWEDLAKPGVSVVMPDVRSSGGAVWNIAAIYGAVVRGKTRQPATTEGATLLLRKILANAGKMDHGARQATSRFLKGDGDVLVTYENEALAAKNSGSSIECVMPTSTVRIDNPIAVVDAYAQKHHTVDVATAFVAFLLTPEAQKVFAEHGYRPVLASVATQTADRFLPTVDLFTVDDLGGWDTVKKEIFAAGRVYDQAIGGK